MWKQGVSLSKLDGEGWRATAANCCYCNVINEQLKTISQYGVSRSFPFFHCPCLKVAQKRAQQAGGIRKMEQGSNTVQSSEDVVGLPSAFPSCLLSGGGLWGKGTAGKGWRVTRLQYELRLLPKSGVTTVMPPKDCLLWASFLFSV